MAEPKETRVRRVLSAGLYASNSALAFIAMCVAVIEKYASVYRTGLQLLLIVVLAGFIITAVIMTFIYLKIEQSVPEKLTLLWGDTTEMNNEIQKRYGRVAALIWLIVQTLRSLPYILKIVLSEPNKLSPRK
jgi:hypothetical protein